MAGDDVAALTHICRQLEGMPLGIELAAGWVDVLALDDIANEIAKNLDFLETEWRDVPARHRSVRAVFDTSWNRLDERERDTFARLCVFRGGFTRAAAGEVAGADLRTLSRLVDKSLLQFNRSQDRYEVHELLRQYGAAKLAQDGAAEAEARERHSAYYCGALGRWGVDLKGPRQSAALNEIETDIENVRTAWGWAAAEKNVARLDQALFGIFFFFRMRTRDGEGIAACQLAIDALAQVNPTDTAFGDALRTATRAMIRKATSQRLHADWTLVDSLLRKSQELLNSPALVGHDTRLERGLLLNELGWSAMHDQEKALQLLEKSVALYRSVGDRWMEAWCLGDLAFAYEHHGDVTEAKGLFEQSLALFQLLGDPYGTMYQQQRLGDVAAHLGDFGEAKRRYKESVALSQAWGDQATEAFFRSQLGHTFRLCGDYEAARRLYNESLALVAEAIVRYPALGAWLGLGQLALNVYDPGQAGSMFEASLAVSEEIQWPWSIGSSLAGMGHVALLQGQFKAAAETLRQSVDVLRDAGDRQGSVVEQANLGMTFCLSGEFDRANAAIDEAQMIVAGLEGAELAAALVTLFQSKLMAVSGQYDSTCAQAQTALNVARGAADERLMAWLWGAARWFHSYAEYTKQGIIGRAHGIVGWAALGQENYGAAEASLNESIVVLREIGDREYAAWARAALAWAAHGLGDLAEARCNLYQGLTTAVEIRAFIPLLHLMPIITLILAEEEDVWAKERAVELHAMSISQPFLAKAQLFEDIAWRQVRAATASLPPDVVEAAEARGRALDWWETAEMLVEELAGWR